LLIELILRNKLQFVKTQQNLNLPAPNRRIELINTEITGEFLLDETIGLMKRSEPLSLTNWIAYLNGNYYSICMLISI
jgi:Golgi phosphoprotein 3